MPQIILAGAVIRSDGAAAAREDRAAASLKVNVDGSPPSHSAHRDACEVRQPTASSEAMKRAPRNKLIRAHEWCYISHPSTIEEMSATISDSGRHAFRRGRNARVGKARAQSGDAVVEVDVHRPVVIALDPINFRNVFAGKFDVRVRIARRG